jgi:Fe-S-cluster containining protein
MHSKIPRLQTLYDRFENQARPYKAEAACRKGCAFCCTDAGAIHITTLEGLAIRQATAALAKPQRAAIAKKLAKEQKQREKRQTAPCPFLMKNKACMIYAARPFACRRIYSLKTCNKAQSPVLSRSVMAMGDEAIRALQRLDDTGYSGHISYILYMLASDRFLETYLCGEFKPEEVTDFGKSHRILINHMVAAKPNG